VLYARLRMLIAQLIIKGKKTAYIILARMVIQSAVTRSLNKK
jgi:hypothetical protein